ncbi:MAG: hypothetical protein LBB22_00080 [Treponema sp.]|jgi:hypothetical protein|nr:hypothetical protein [Treponema sp.]
MESPDISEDCKAGHNPLAAMNRRLNAVVGRILKINRGKKYGEKASCQGDGQVPFG